MHPVQSAVAELFIFTTMPVGSVVFQIMETSMFAVPVLSYWNIGVVIKSELWHDVPPVTHGKTELFVLAEVLNQTLAVDGEVVAFSEGIAPWPGRVTVKLIEEATVK